MGEQELSECHHDEDTKETEPFIDHGRNSLNRVLHQYRHSHYLLLILHIFSSLLLLAYIATDIYYLVFKIKLYYKELPVALSAPWLLVILGCECLYLMCTIISAVDYLVPPITSKSPPSNCEAVLHSGDDFELHSGDDFDVNSDLIASHRYPTVDVMIPCCKEPTDVPQESILAALALKYPKDRFKVLVLDDGGDEDLKAFCDTIRVESGSDQLIYLRREKIPGMPHHFKCGNMNYGLQHSKAEYVVMMDADMILHPSFLNQTLPHIVSSPNVSFVQVPQSFYNLPTGDPLNDACGFGYDRVMVHRNTLRCTPCVGTGAIFRRKQLDEIGGFQPQSITEDTMTAYTLFNHGYKSVYINEKLQIGLTPWTFEGFVKQRQRWGQGAIQQFVATWKSMLGKGSKLSIHQKSCYFWHTGYYYMSIINTVLMLMLWGALAFRLDLTIGDDEDNRTLLSYLAVCLIIWRVFWYVIWLEVPQSIQSRNRDESQFWWMTPFFLKMVVGAAMNFKSTFKFVPTSNIDRNAAAGKANLQDRPWMKKFSDLKHVKEQIAFVIVIFTTVLVRGYTARTRHDCREEMMVVGLSLFLLSVCAHMSVPVLHILWPAGFKPEQRKSLLKFTPEGVPVFDPTQIGPKWHIPPSFSLSLSPTSMLPFGLSFFGRCRPASISATAQSTPFRTKPLGLFHHA